MPPTTGPRARDLAAGRVRPTQAEIDANPGRTPLHAETELQRPRTAAEDRAHLSQRTEARRQRDATRLRPNLP